MSDDKKPYLDCHYPKSLIQVDKNEKKISELENKYEDLDNKIGMQHEDYNEGYYDAIKEYKERIEKLEHQLNERALVTKIIDRDNPEIRKEIEELKNLYSHCGHNLQKIIKNREVLREFMESERKVHDLGIEYYNYDHHIIKLDELIKKLSGEKEVRDSRDLGRRELREDVGLLPNTSKPEEPNESITIHGLTPKQKAMCYGEILEEKAEEKPKGKTIICPNCMRQFQFKHKYYKIVSKEDLKFLFEITKYWTGDIINIDYEDKHLNRLKELKEKYEVGKE